MHLSTEITIYFASRNQNFQYKGGILESKTENTEQQDTVAAK